MSLLLGRVDIRAAGDRLPVIDPAMTLLGAHVAHGAARHESQIGPNAGTPSRSKPCTGP